jgi:hypothetical protein
MYRHQAGWSSGNALRLMHDSFLVQILAGTSVILFYFGVLHPVACIISRLLEEPSLATTFQDIYFIFCRYIFRPLLAILRRNIQLPNQFK